MKKLALFVCLFVFVNSFAQVNLVRNPSFEQIYPHCPVRSDEIRLATGWSCIDTNATSITDSFQCNTNCTPEYFNSCGTPYLYGVPHNFSGFQYARTGNGFANVWMYDDSVTSGADTATIHPYQRDYLMGRLYQPLTLGQSYCVTFYVNMANNAAFIVNHIGAYLDDGSIDTNNLCGIPHSQYTPQIEELEMIGDTLGWTKVQGSFTANGTEKYITIGNFASRLNTDTICWHGTGSPTGHTGSYYEVDDVSVIASNTPAYAGLDDTLNYGDSTYIGIDSNGLGMPCLWYLLGDTARSTPIDSGGRILVHPLATTTYVVVMDLCGTITSDTVVVTVRPVGVPTAQRLKYINIYPNPASGVVHVGG